MQTLNILGVYFTY